MADLTGRLLMDDGEDGSMPLGILPARAGQGGATLDGNTGPLARGMMAIFTCNVFRKLMSRWTQSMLHYSRSRDVKPVLVWHVRLQQHGVVQGNRSASWEEISQASLPFMQLAFLPFWDPDLRGVEWPQCGGRLTFEGVISAKCLAAYRQGHDDRNVAGGPLSTHGRRGGSGPSWPAQAPPHTLEGPSGKQYSCSTELFLHPDSALSSDCHVDVRVCGYVPSRHSFLHKGDILSQKLSADLTVQPSLCTSDLQATDLCCRKLRIWGAWGGRTAPARTPLT
jgi:hypothetical protein